MKKSICLLSIVASTVLLGNEVEVPTVNVAEKINTKVVKDISEDQLKSADLAEALSKNVPSISIVRRNGIANDIILRGQKKDNINVLIDDAKIYGACPNRMDPVTSHILTNNVESVEVIEGPYDVENFGTLSGKVQVHTKEPTKDLHGEVNLNAGSFNYRKASATISGGTDRFKLLLSASTEKSDQYKDGNGNNFYEQQVEKGVSSTTRYKDSNEKAYTKKTLLSKLIFNIDDSSEVKLSYTANRSDNVLYPAGGMDADYDDSNIYTIGYTKRDLGKYSKELNLDYYYSDVDHPMSTKLRNPTMMYMTSHMKTSIWGTKLKNSMELADSILTVGLDTSVRNWRSNNYQTSITTGKITPTADSFPSTDTTNKAIFAKLEKDFGKLNLDFGSRYDHTNIEPDGNTKNERKYNALSANVFAVYNQDEFTKYFAGIGKSSRVPDARELYFSGMGSKGNQDLKQTKNYEADLGFEKTIGNFNIKSKLFYSVLKDYIYNNATSKKFENVDAKIYGAEISGFYLLGDSFSADYGIAYQRGKKDKALDGQTNKNLAEIPPLKANIALNYEYSIHKLTAEMVAVDNWNKIDSDNGEQKLGGYALFNLKYKNSISKNFEITLGVDNVFDKTYASTNTYKDISYTVIGGNQITFNDPGRYGYINLRYKF
ncbi:TonB-dependent receptor [Arcobacter nitrofigilis DSM 7299]|uniref:TonB-dependent receptor n=1 Tax=Arcobacter nitrofigilis (strain ATCC 33309 / DSM 7299 / CCUG 15893 / LMG 7604 / NCTC 12251 / CI) TaxID=572480 RepID=D5V2Y4_ARCNC|nr:TonB-dependent receptor [Arcobacter nitrofigilis]ADG92566.1 TonB-dependent receptor [Arcobacter nitrofigilis DSM 7299]